jgi:hypothetical protein
MDKFIITNVHDATPKKPKIKLQNFPHIFLVVWLKKIIKLCVCVLIIMILHEMFFRFVLLRTYVQIFKDEYF